MFKRLYIFLALLYSLDCLASSELLVDFHNQLTQLTTVLGTSTSVQSIWRPRIDFFEDIMGDWENVFMLLYKNNPEKIREYIRFEGKNSIITNSKTNQEYQAGFFEQYTIQELRKKSEELFKKPRIQILGTFSVIEAIEPIKNGVPTSFHKFVDVGALQASPEYHDAVFQVASNFSTLEPTGINHSPELGVTGYINDHTQGPFASISAAPGLIYRMYYMYHNSNTTSQLWRQTKDHQINLLDLTTIPVINGYIVLNNDYLKKDAIDQEYEKIKIGLHTDIQVTFGHANQNEHELVQNPDQQVSQVFTAGVDFGSTNAWYAENSQAKKIAQRILDAAYEGTLLAAFTEGKKKVVLTLIGGGVFRNPLSTILNSIEKMLPFIEKSGLEVILVVYDSSTFNKTDLDRLKTFVKEPGTYYQYSTQHPNGMRLK